MLVIAVPRMPLGRSSTRECSAGFVPMTAGTRLCHLSHNALLAASHRIPVGRGLGLLLDSNGLCDESISCGHREPLKNAALRANLGFWFSASAAGFWVTVQLCSASENRHQ